MTPHSFLPGNCCRKVQSIKPLRMSKILWISLKFHLIIVSYVKNLLTKSAHCFFIKCSRKDTLNTNVFEFVGKSLTVKFWHKFFLISWQSSGHFYNLSGNSLTLNLTWHGKTSLYQGITWRLESKWLSLFLQKGGRLKLDNTVYYFLWHMNLVADFNIRLF